MIFNFYIIKKQITEIINARQPIRIVRIISPITAGIALRISGRNLESGILIPMIHNTTSNGIMKSPPIVILVNFILLIRLPIVTT